MEDFHCYPVNASKKKATSMKTVIEFKHPFFQLERNTKHNGRLFTHYPVNALENGDFNRGRKIILKQWLKFWLERRKKLKGHGPTREKTEWIRRFCFFIEASVLSLAWDIQKVWRIKKNA